MWTNIWKTHFPGHRFSKNETTPADEFSTKGVDSDTEIQAFKFSMLRDPPPSKENEDCRKRALPPAASASKRPCAAHGTEPSLVDSSGSKGPVVSAPPRPEIEAFLEPAVAPTAMKTVRALPPFLKPTPAALGLFNEQNYKFMMDYAKKRAEAMK